MHFDKLYDGILIVFIGKDHDSPKVKKMVLLKIEFILLRIIDAQIIDEYTLP